MKTFKTKKNLNKAPEIFGLKLPFFFALCGIGIASIFVLLSNISLLRFGVMIGVNIGIYAIMKTLSSTNVIKNLTNEKFPDVIRNDNFK